MDLVRGKFRRPAFGVIAVAVVGFIALTSISAIAADKVRVGVLSYGTGQWEMDVIKTNKLAEAEGLDLEIVGLGRKLTHAIALENKSVEIVMTDYLWVSEQRAAGADFTFVPHSKVAGGVIARPDRGIETLADLKGKTLGIVGGPSEDNWLVLRAYTKKALGFDIGEEATVKFVGAPPLLNEAVEKGDLDAVMNFWHYNARLRAKGYTDLVAIEDMLSTLGVKHVPPILGWVFSEAWANENPQIATGFLRASLAAKKKLKGDGFGRTSSNAEWDRLAGKMKAEGDAGLHTALRDAYRAGIPDGYGDREITAAEEVFAMLSRETGEARTIAPGTFWAGFRF